MRVVFWRRSAWGLGLLLTRSVCFLHVGPLRLSAFLPLDRRFVNRCSLP